ncbi:hypothetical protein EV683_1311 [Crenobacter luteus]|nr:hypothetical protein EV683_1311 [Crenobacter luteus]
MDLKTQYQHLKPAIDARLHSVFDHGQYIMGPEVAELEAALAAYVSSPGRLQTRFLNKSGRCFCHSFMA